jgi:hypothetical protein
VDRARRRDLRRSERGLGALGREAGRRTGRSRRAGLGALVVVALVAAGGLLVGVVREGTWSPEWFRPRAYVEIDGQPVAVPRPAPASGRLLPMVPVTTEGGHAFLHLRPDGSPVGYDPCRPIRFVVRPDGMPEGGQQLIDEAVAIVSSASGLAFEPAGTTDEAPAVDRLLIQPDRYGDGWAPVLIAWADETQVPELAGEVAGLGGSAAVPGASGEGLWLAGGRVVLDAVDLTGMLGRTDGWAQARAIVAHELAHVLGLDHVGDPTELMHEISSVRTDFGPGDLQGLATVGQVACEE